MKLLIHSRYARIGASSRIRFYQYLPWLDAVGIERALVAQLDQIRAKGGLQLRSRARELFGLEVAEQSYRQIYAALEGAP